MLNRFKRALLATALLGTSGLLGVLDAAPLRIGVERNNPPLSFPGPDGRQTGFMVELVQEMSRVSGREMVAVPDFWRKNLAAFHNGQLDALGNLADTPANRDEVTFSVGHARLHAVIFTRPGAPAPSRTTDFAGLTIATVAGTAANAQARQSGGWGARIVTYGSWQEAFAATASGACDATLFSNQLYPATPNAGEFTRHFIEDLDYPYHFGVRHGDTQTLAVLNEALAQLMRSGEFDRLYAKWIGPIEPRKLRLSDVQPYLLPVAIALIAVVAFILWQRHLLRRLGEQAAALRISEQRWRFALDGSGAAVWDWDLSTGRTFYSVALQRMLGYKDEELGDRPETALQLVHPDERAKVESTLAIHRRLPDRPFLIEHRMRCKDGTWKWVINRGMAVERDAKGSPVRMIGTLVDLTLRKQAEEDRLVLGKLESTGILAGGIAHDFNNLLTAINLNLDMALWPDVPPAQVADLLGNIRTAVGTAHQLTQQLITFASGGAPIRRAAALHDVIAESTRTALAGSPHRARLDLSPDLWRAEVDLGQIGQVMRNLVVNAREAMIIPGTVTVRARNLAIEASAVRGLPAGHYVQVSVSDTGPGVPAEVQLRIFDPYFSTKQRGDQKGMGLGLTIALSVITRHRGTITFETNPDKGAAFHVYLPALDGEPASAPAPDTPASAPVGRAHRVLIMDDDPDVRLVLVATLRKLGCEVEETADGQAAIEAFRLARAAREPFDVVILDLSVQGAMGGLDALRGLQKIDPAVAAIVISGYADDEVLRDHRRFGFRAALPKPFSLDGLQTALTEASGGTPGEAAAP